MQVVPTHCQLKVANTYSMEVVSLKRVKALLFNSRDQLRLGVHFQVASFMIDSSPYRVFSLTWPASRQICWHKRKRLHEKTVYLPQDWFGKPTWPPFHCFGTPIWPPWCHVKTLYSGTLEGGHQGYCTCHSVHFKQDLRKKSHKCIFNNYWYNPIETLWQGLSLGS